MAYIGKDPADSFISFVKQDFSVSATTSYTLDNAVTNENEIALFINHVRQEPTTAYTASGTSLTLTSATASGDDMYCVYLGMAKQTVNAPDGSVGSSQVASTIITGQTAETSIATDDTVLIHDTSAGALRKMTRANFVSGIGGTNTPSWFANKTDTTSVANTTNTKCTFNVEIIDTDSAFASSTFTVPSGAAGKYFVFGSTQFDSNITNEDFNVAFIYINGAIQAKGVFTHAVSSVAITSQVQGIFDLSASDTVELYVRHNEGGSLNLRGESGEKTTFFGGYKLIT